MKYLNLEKKHLMIIIYVLVSIIVLIWVSFWVKKYLDYRAEKKVEQINIILDNATENRDNCEIVFDFDKNQVKGNKFFSEAKYDWMKARCDEKYNISHIEIDEENCKDLIKQNKNFFSVDYIILNDFEKKREQCIASYLKVKFSTWILFDVENDFKSEIKLDFSLDFFTDLWDENSEEYINNRIDAKKRLKDLIVVEPSVDFTIDDIYLTPNRWILRLPLNPKTKYTIFLKDFDTKLWEKTQNEKFEITTPENKYFWMKILDKVTLYQNTNPPKFQVLEYNSSITKTKVKLCRIPDDTYAKIEVYRKRAETINVKDFFKKDIDTLKNFDCSEKEIVLKDNNKTTLNKKDLSFTDIASWTPKSWLYFIEFSNPDDREYNGKFNYPIFFWIVDSHITMKVSRNGEAFFFVNDFEWNPIWNQKVSLYLNDFKDKEKIWNDKKRDYDTKYMSVLDKNIYSETVELWVTWDDWILKVNLKDKVWDAFLRTFDQPWDYDWEGIYRTFFVKSASDKNLSYINSTWNSWIAPWNFWYTVSNWYWYDTQENQDAIILDRYSMAEPDYYSHIYTDRLLYLPWETVNIKTLVRDSKDLSIPEAKDFTLKVSDSNGKEILSKEYSTSEYGSFSDSLKLPDATPLGNYNINLQVDWNSIWYAWFSVEVFKNPKFKNEITIETDWLNDWLVKIDKTDVKKHRYWEETTYSWKFKIKAKVFSKYYNWALVSNANFTYKIYKQYYYEDSYWDDCYYWCYWEPYKEFYSEWKWVLDANGIWSFEADVDFYSNYSDYKYIVEVTVTDSVWDTISWSNSIIAKLPAEYKKYNNDLSVAFNSDQKFIKAWNSLEINGWLEPWKWSDDYNDKFLFVIKKKEYKTIEVDDIRWAKRPVTRVSEKLEKVMLVNNKNFSPTLDWRLRLNYKLDDVWEYVFEYWKINTQKNIDINKEIEAFNNEKVLEKIVDVTNDIKVCKANKNYLSNTGDQNSTQYDDCSIVTNTTKENMKLDDLFDTKKFFTIFTYGNTDWSNPVNDDNKIRVIPENISYHLWDKARVLVRLPFSKWKILWTVEKQWVLQSEYIDVTSNVFFKEIDVDDTFIPNAYIWVVAIEVDWNKVPEYKVWYSEIVVDKTDKKSYITIEADKKTYKPRDKVTLNLKVEDKMHNPKPSELTVMVVDDSLISLLWNVDLNTLEKFYKKLPFQIQTSLTNIAMLWNYYFSRPWIVGWSWFGNFKWWDSAVSTRNIFKNTAYYNPSVITDKDWNAKVSFDLPDNLTNFRVMVVSNSKDNMFWYAESFIEVRKNVIIEDKTPIILRDWDISSIWANIFNNTDKEIWFKVELTSNISVKDPVKNITVPAWQSVNTIWEVKADANQEEIKYSISALWDSLENSDKLENTISVKQSPDLVTHVIKSWVVEAWNNIKLPITIPQNTDMSKSKVKITVSNNKLVWIEKIVTSLAEYPYWCIEQTTSTTLPNAILKKFDNLFSGIIEDPKTIDWNLEYWIQRIKSMQTSEWWFAYWEWSSESNLQITPYVVRSLIEIRDSWIKLPEWLLEKAIAYLEKNINNPDITDIEKAEAYWALAKAWKVQNITMDEKNMDRHTILAYTYGMIINNKFNHYKTIDKNIEKLKDLMNNWEEYNRYWNDMTDKAIFASMLIDYNYSKNYTDELIWQLYEYDWMSYYYSTQAKNNAFMAFAKYIEKNSVDSSSKFMYSLWSYLTKNDILVWKTNLNVYKNTFDLKDVMWNNNELLFSLANIEWNRLYVDVTLEAFPLDKTKVKTYSNWITIKRQFYEVIDEDDIEKICRWTYPKNNSSWEYICTEPKWLKLVDWKQFKKWVMYKVKNTVELKNMNNKRNLIIEDYLAWSFRIINSKFNTEQIGIRQNQTDWSWNHTEFRPDVVMANATYIWDWTQNFEYYFVPEFEWKFTLPPVVAYMMYNPKIRANTQFSNISVK